MARRSPWMAPAVGDVVTYPPWAAVLVVTRVTSTRVAAKVTRLERCGASPARNTIERRGRSWLGSTWATFDVDGAEVIYLAPGGAHP